MEKANHQDKGKKIVEDVSVDLTLDLPMETQMEYWRQRNLLPPMDTEMEWRQQNYPFSVTRMSSLPRDTEIEWRQRLEAEMAWRRRMDTEIESRKRLEAEMDWRRRMETEIECRRRMETDMEWRQISGPFSVTRAASMPPMETQTEWGEMSDPFSVNRTASLPPMETGMDFKERRDLRTQTRGDTQQNRWDKLKNVIVVEENEGNGTSSLSSPSGSGSVGSFGSAGTSSETQQHLPNQVDGTFIEGASGSSNAIPPVSGTLEQMQHLVLAAIEATNEKSPDFSRKEGLRNFLLKMPGVSTKGDGPNGKKTEGFLYAYKRGGEVKIVCICHGYFLTPAEFVKHAGGGDVENPLRLITVDPN
ncbi:ninja-family protein AFP3-like [Solanum lycopersicum]|uniref:ninja-family protein AFP3-like n=1 Tax=Solanum lycopersicum TaxID=4081 RepID=UPI00374A4B6E